MKHDVNGEHRDIMCRMVSCHYNKSKLLLLKLLLSDNVNNEISLYKTSEHYLTTNVQHMDCFDENSYEVSSKLMIDCPEIYL
jgi:hypothetical protein